MHLLTSFLCLALAFEVASIKLFRDEGGPGVSVALRMSAPKLPGTLIGKRFTDRHATVETLVTRAYGVDAHQIVGLPNWAKPGPTDGGDYYEIDAVAPMENATREQLQEMLKQLLADRFSLLVHTDRRQLPVFVLGIADGGLKVSPVARTAPNTYVLLQLLSRYLEAPIVDRTGLTQGYDFSLHGMPREAMGSSTAISRFLQEQYGLKIEPRKEMTDVVVIDHVQKPSAN